MTAFGEGPVPDARGVPKNVAGQLVHLGAAPAGSMPLFFYYKKIPFIFFHLLSFIFILFILCIIIYFVPFFPSIEA